MLILGLVAARANEPQLLGLYLNRPKGRRTKAQLYRIVGLQGFLVLLLHLSDKLVELGNDLPVDIEHLLRRD